MPITIGFNTKKIAALLLGLLSSCSIPLSKIRSGRKDGWYYMEFPNTDVTMAALKGFLYCRKIGYVMGVEFPKDTRQIWRTT